MKKKINKKQKSILVLMQGVRDSKWEDFYLFIFINFFFRNMEFQSSEFIGPRTKVHLLDESYA